MSELGDALEKHGSAVDAVLNENVGDWPIGQSMQLYAMMMREIAEAEKERGEKAA